MTGKRLKSKGAASRSTLTANGRVDLRRRRFQLPGGGAVVPSVPLLDKAEATLSHGTRQLCCQLNGTGKSFRRTAENLQQAAQLCLSAESLRQLVEAEGKRVQQASESGALKPQWRASECRVRTPQGEEVSRVYTGVDGFMAPMVTEAEKQARRKQVVAARRKRGKDQAALPPLPRRRKGANQRYQEFKLVQFHDETMDRRLVSVTRKNCQEAGYAASCAKPEKPMRWRLRKCHSCRPGFMGARARNSAAAIRRTRKCGVSLCQPGGMPVQAHVDKSGAMTVGRKRTDVQRPAGHRTHFRIARTATPARSTECLKNFLFGWCTDRCT